jgi:hypothetical protein
VQAQRGPEAGQAHGRPQPGRLQVLEGPIRRVLHQQRHGRSLHQGATGLPVRVRGRGSRQEDPTVRPSKHTGLQHPDREGVHGDARGRIPRHPPHLLRRINFLKECQKPKQAYGDFVAKLEAQGGEADLAGITPDDLFVLRMIAGAYDDELRNKFLKEANPTKAVLLRMAKEHERAERTNRALGKEAVGVNAAQDKSEGQGPSVGEDLEEGERDQGLRGQAQEGGKVRILRRILRQVRQAGRAEVHPLRQEGSPGRRVRVQGAEPCPMPKQAQKTYAKAVTGERRGRGERLHHNDRHGDRLRAHAEDPARAATR